VQKVRTNIEMFIFEILREAEQVSFKRLGEGGGGWPFFIIKLKWIEICVHCTISVFSCSFNYLISKFRPSSYSRIQSCMGSIVLKIIIQEYRKMPLILFQCLKVWKWMIWQNRKHYISLVRHKNLKLKIMLSSAQINLTLC